MNNLSPELMKALGLTVMDALWQGALLLMAVLLFLSLFKKTSSRLKYRIIVMSMLLMPIWSLISFNQHYHPSGDLEASDVSIPVFDIQLGSMIETPLEGVLTPESSFFQTITNWMSDNANLAATFWFLGVLVFGFRLFGGLIYIRLIKQGAVDITNQFWLDRLVTITKSFKIRNEVGLKQSSKVTSPIVMGFLKPIIIFPIGLIEGLPTDQVEAIIAHELAHLKRLDYLTNLLLSALQVAYFFHPAYWWLYRQAEQEREYHCDQLAVRYIGSKVTLIKALTTVRELQLPGYVPSMAFSRRKHQLLQRILRIADNNSQTNWLSGVVSLVLIVLAFGLMSWQKVSTNQADKVEGDKKELIGQPTDSVQKLGQNAVQIPAFSQDSLNAKKTPKPIAQNSLIGLPIYRSMSDTIPDDDNRVSGDYKMFNGMYQYLLDAWKETEGRKMSARSEELIYNLEQLDEADSTGLIDGWKLAIESLTNDLTGETLDREAEEQELEKQLSQMELLHRELQLSQAKLEEGLVIYDAKLLEEAQERMAKLEEELSQVDKAKLSEEEQRKLLELIEITSNSVIRMDRRIELFKKNQSKFEKYFKLQKWADLEINEPISRVVYDNNYEVLHFNVTDAQAQSGQYKFDFKENDLAKALVILDGEIVDDNTLNKLNAIGITNLAVVESITGKMAKLMFPNEMKTYDSVVRVMTSNYAKSAKGKAKTETLRRLLNRTNRPFIGGSASLLIYGWDACKVVLNGRAMDDLLPSKVFEKYGKRYTSNLMVRRDLALELYGRKFLGGAQGVFFPFIDGKNSSVDEFYRKLGELNEKMDQNQSMSPELVETVKYYLKRKAELDLVQNQLMTQKLALGDDVLIVLNDYVRKDLTFGDLEKMDLTDVSVLSGNEAKSLYGEFMVDKVGVLKVYSGSSGSIEYGNTMDPRALKENSNQYKLPPFQSEIEAFDKVLKAKLLEDKLIENGDEITVFLEFDKLLINFEDQPKRILRRYLKLYEKTMGFELNKDITYYYNK